MGFLVDLAGRWFEFPALEFTASAACVSGATTLFTSPPVFAGGFGSKSVVVVGGGEFSEVDFLAGLPNLGLWAGAASESG